MEFRCNFHLLGASLTLSAKPSAVKLLNKLKLRHRNNILQPVVVRNGNTNTSSYRYRPDRIGKNADC